MRVPLLALLLAVITGASQAQTSEATPRLPFIELTPLHGGPPVALRATQVVRVGRLEGHTIVDTLAWVQQPTAESIESVARRVMATGHRLIPLTDPTAGRIWIGADSIVLVREANSQHTIGARAALVLDGLRFRAEIAVRETLPEVIAALERDAADRASRPGTAAGR